ncbi:hypothetical protein PISL3812_00577 [Talaromyces islandicus]|uniref:Uncharacterized protein n=1 Tax=Talaromyces islandicus TaxID=28573 RepID=A0A0U1LLE5_TALIS|nr:hypothetical protein PISL3812_00577 [Talaromyces islandicus]
MQFLTFSLLATLAAASPIMRRQPATNTSVWPVSNFEVGCSPAACEYSFIVTRAAGPSNPGFNTTCTGNDLDKDFQACDDKSVTARLVPHLYPEWEINVKHSFEGNNKAAVHSFANGTTEADKPAFTVTVYKTD